MIDHHPSDARPARCLGGVHRLELAMVCIEPPERPDRQQIAAATSRTVERHGPVRRSRRIHGVHVSGGCDHLRELVMHGPQLHHVGTLRIVLADQQRRIPAAESGGVVPDAFDRLEVVEALERASPMIRGVKMPSSASSSAAETTSCPR